ncbi:MAG: MAPEG family protein, partial [Proteobacteria bacterium]
GDSNWCLAYALIFTVARALHAVALQRAIQPMRTIAYLVGVLCCFGLGFAILWRVVENYRIS